MQAENLQAMKYKDLQMLAKTHGVRANQKGEELIKELRKVTKKVSIRER